MREGGFPFVENLFVVILTVFHFFVFDPGGY